MKIRKFTVFFIVFFLISGDSFSRPDTIFYRINFSEAQNNVFNVEAKLRATFTGVMDFKIPEWTPGYYQLLDFSKNVSHVEAHLENRDNSVEVIKLDENTWRIPVEKGKDLSISYKILAGKKFIALPFLNTNWAFIRPTGIFLFPMANPDILSAITLEKPANWLSVSGMKHEGNTYYAENMDQLYDSPILAGDLKEIQTFSVKGIPHFFAGIELNLPRENDLLESLGKIVTVATDLMGDIPYRQYSFMSIGAGNGGIEQTNSTAFALDAASYGDSAGRQKILNFLTHEYFHHFNVKRIRPIELGPFNYSGKNRTNLLWVSEGLTVYFEDIILNRAGLKSRDEMLRDWAGYIENYENNPGRKFQTLAESSYHTWEDGPFGIKGKTISYYEKGPVIGMLLDLRIRQLTQNGKSLTDVMRKLYQKYYKEKNRGFTENEFKDVCEKIAGAPLDDIFSYVYNTEDIPYEKYFAPAGLTIVRTRTGEKDRIKISIMNRTSPLQTQILNDLFRTY